MHGFILAATAATAVLLGGAAQATTWTVSPFDIPSTTGPDPFGINDSGVIVGSSDAGGFIDTHGSFQIVNPSSGFAALTGISNSGLAVASDTISNSFFYQGGSFTPFSLPGVTATVIRGISASGRYITGFYTDAASNETGYVWDRVTSTLSSMTIPAGADILVIQGVNDAGVATGSLTNGEALIYDSKTNTSNYFSTSGDLTGLRFRAINDDGLIGGWGVAPDGSFVGIIGTPGTGFATFDLGGGGDTIVYGLNNSGQAVGSYTDAAGVQHGFVATTISSVPEPSSTALLLAGLLAAGGWHARRRTKA